jgi:hypothetical protein
MTKENRFEGLMGVVGKNKNTQTSKPQNDSDFKSSSDPADEISAKERAAIESQARSGVVGRRPVEPTEQEAEVLNAQSDVQKSSSKKKFLSKSNVETSNNLSISTSDNSDVQTSETQSDNSNRNISTSKSLDTQTSKKAKSVNPDYTRTTVYLPKKMHKKLKAIALDEEREMSSILEELIETWLSSRK